MPIEAARPPGGFDRSTRKLALGLIPALALHNLEEGLTFPHLPETVATVADWVRLPAVVPDWNRLRLALVLATIFPAGIAAWSLLRPATAFKAAALAMLATVLLANALVPHLALTVLTAGYTPGAVTALLVNIPLCLGLLSGLRTTGMLTNSQFALACALGAIALPVALAGTLWLSGALLS